MSSGLDKFRLPELEPPATFEFMAEIGRGILIGLVLNSAVWLAMLIWALWLGICLVTYPMIEQALDLADSGYWGPRGSMINWPYQILGYPIVSLISMMIFSIPWRAYFLRRPRRLMALWWLPLIVFVIIFGGFLLSLFWPIFFS